MYQRKLLFSKNEGDFISIGITEDGTGYGRYPVPWGDISNAYNMKLPKVYLSKEDLKDQEIMEKLSTLRVNGCYIFCPLEDYSFLNRFSDMMDLNIHFAENLKDLSFLKNLTACRQLYLSKAHLSNINEVVSNRCRGLAMPRCLALYDCIIDDISYLHECGTSFNELVICNPKSRDEHMRWKGLCRMRYHDIKE